MARREKTAHHSVLMENTVIQRVSLKGIYMIAGKQGNRYRETFLSASGQSLFYISSAGFSSDLAKQIAFQTHQC